MRATNKSVVENAMRRMVDMLPAWSGKKRRRSHGRRDLTFYPSFALAIAVMCLSMLQFRSTLAWAVSKRASLLHPAIHCSLICGTHTSCVPAVSLLSGSQSNCWQLSATSSLSSSNLATPIGEEDATQSKEERLFFVRPALLVDMGRASKILSDGFFKHKTNIITYQFERLQTYLSLESTFPKPNTYHEIFVACCAKRGTVWGMVEVDARPNSDRDTAKDGPYMCNLAVDDQRQRMGIATALVRECEQQVRLWYEQDRRRGLCNESDEDLTVCNSLCLKVRESNRPAIELYAKLGYQTVSQEEEEKPGETILLMRKQLFDF
jgi:ribosomal protein S18 acetylase RimI-like enzyme